MTAPVSDRAPESTAASARRLYRVVVTYEFENRPPQDVELEIAAVNLRLAARAALVQIRKTLQVRNATSMVVLVDTQLRRDMR